MSGTIVIPMLNPGNTELPVLCCCHPDNLIGYFVRLPDSVVEYDELEVLVANEKRDAEKFKIMAYGDDEILAVNAQHRTVEHFDGLSEFRRATSEEVEAWKAAGRGKWKWRKDAEA